MGIRAEAWRTAVGVHELMEDAPAVVFWLPQQQLEQV